MRQVTAMIQVHSHHFISRSEHCKLHCHIRLCPGVRLHIGMFGAEQLPGARDGEPFDLIDDLVADIAVVFNWPPSEVFTMELGEVIAWRERAAVRSGASDSEKP